MWVKEFERTKMTLFLNLELWNDNEAEEKKSAQPQQKLDK